MASSKQIKMRITNAKKTSARLTKELNASKTKITKLNGELKKAVTKEKVDATKKKAAAAKKKPAKKKVVKKKR